MSFICSICIDDNCLETASVVLRCGHLFGEKCLRRHFQQRLTCPNCSSHSGPTEMKRIFPSRSSASDESSKCAALEAEKIKLACELSKKDANFVLIVNTLKAELSALAKAKAKAESQLQLSLLELKELDRDNHSLLNSNYFLGIELKNVEITEKALRAEIKALQQKLNATVTKVNEGNNSNSNTTIEDLTKQLEKANKKISDLMTISIITAGNDGRNLPTLLVRLDEAKKDKAKLTEQANQLKQANQKLQKKLNVAQNAWEQVANLTKQFVKSDNGSSSSSSYTPNNNNTTAASTSTAAIKISGSSISKPATQKEDVETVPPKSNQTQANESTNRTTLQQKEQEQQQQQQQQKQKRKRNRKKNGNSSKPQDNGQSGSGSILIKA